MDEEEAKEKPAEAPAAKSKAPIVVRVRRDGKALVRGRLVDYGKASAGALITVTD